MRPVIIEIGPLSVYSWGLFFVLALATGTWMVMRNFRREGREPMQALDMGLWIGVAALVGARVLYVLIEWRYYLEYPGQLLRIGEGLSFHGGLIGGFLAGYLVARRIGLKLGPGADMAAPAVCLGYAIARIGCFLNGCCYGLPTTVPWAVTMYGIPRHPTQLYSFIATLAVLAVLLWLRGRPRPFAGSLWLYYLGLYSVTRFFLEFWRESTYLVGWLKVAQAASIGIALAAFGLIWVLSRRSNRVATPQ